MCVTSTLLYTYPMTCVCVLTYWDICQELNRARFGDGQNKYARNANIQQKVSEEIWQIDTQMLEHSFNITIFFDSISLWFSWTILLTKALNLTYLMPLLPADRLPKAH